MISWGVLCDFPKWESNIFNDIFVTLGVGGWSGFERYFSAQNISQLYQINLIWSEYFITNYDYNLIWFDILQPLIILVSHYLCNLLYGSILYFKGVVHVTGPSSSHGIISTFLHWCAIHTYHITCVQTFISVNLIFTTTNICFTLKKGLYFMVSSTY